jgi:hypothetical protein
VVLVILRYALGWEVHDLDDFVDIDLLRCRCLIGGPSCWGIHCTDTANLDDREQKLDLLVEGGGLGCSLFGRHVESVMTVVVLCWTIIV